jgi:glutamyl-tRNA synthetase
MSVRVRFAPSPTGYLHIGGARTALYNYFYAKNQGGKFILRIEDTDLDRSTREFEQLQIQDLKWLGLVYDEGPDIGGPYAPYRQSERLDIYQKYAQKLIDNGHAYYCFCTEQELEEMKERALGEGRPPHYEGKWKNPQFFEEASARLAAGEKAAIRFRVPLKSYVLNDIVRDRVVYPENMVGDFVLIRSSGLPVYNFCCVVDDIEMKITHVIRGEDHLSNTVRQLMIYDALNTKVPEFAHLSLLIGKDRQKLSKRHGATSVTQYKDQSYLPSAVINYLCLLGWSHPSEKDIFNEEELTKVFNLDRLSKSPAIYDLDKFKWVNGQHIQLLDLTTLRNEVEKLIPKEHPYFKETETWKTQVISFIKAHVEFFSDFEKKMNEDIFYTSSEISDLTKEFMQQDTTKTIKEIIVSEMKDMKNHFMTAAEFDALFQKIKTQTGLKGKPLFMGIRVSLTLKDHGPELKDLIPLTPLEYLKKRMEFSL